MCSDFFINTMMIDQIGILCDLLDISMKLNDDQTIEVDADILDEKWEVSPRYTSCLCCIDVQKFCTFMQQKCVFDGLNYYFGDEIDRFEPEIVQKYSPMA